MQKQIIKGEMEIERDLAERINKLLEIDDFEESQEELRTLGFAEDSTIFQNSVRVNGYIMEIGVYTGQTNAWVEFNVTMLDGRVYEGEPSFEHIDGDYLMTDCEGIDFSLKLNIK